jgi:hypothetical protein
MGETETATLLRTSLETPLPAANVFCSSMLQVCHLADLESLTADGMSRHACQELVSVSRVFGFGVVGHDHMGT